MSSITVADTSLPGLSSVECPQSTLEPGASEHCVASYHTTQHDVDAGFIRNTATAHGTPPGSTVPVVSNPSSVSVPAVRTPAITVRKSATPDIFTVAGAVIRYRYLVTNTGNVALTGVGVSDGLHGLPAVGCPATTLAPHATEACTASYVTTAANLHAGRIVNVATAHGTPPGTTVPIQSARSAVTVPAVLGRPAIALRKSVSPASYDRVGQVLHYTYLVTNIGNATLSHILVKDSLRGLPAIRCPRTMLAPAESGTCTATYRITSADISAMFVRNRAVAQGNPPGSRVPVLSPRAIAIARGQIPVTG
jgi:uncharacterized repeat protein (TIGR01451 family)